jgi:hypothetical protein
MNAGLLKIKRDFKDSRFWLVIEKCGGDPRIGFKRDSKANVERVTIGNYETDIDISQVDDETI